MNKRRKTVPKKFDSKNISYSTEIRLQNIGRIKDLSIVPGRLTIFSGPNGTGKTSALYSIYGVMSQRLARFDTSYSDYLAKALLRNRELVIDLSTLRQDRWVDLLSGASAFFSAALPDVLNCDKKLLPSAKIDFNVDIDRAINERERRFTNVYGRSEEIICRAELDSKKPVLKLKMGAGDFTGHKFASYYITNLLFDIAVLPQRARCYLMPSERAGINLFYQELNSRRAALISNLQKVNIDPFELLREVTLSRYAKPISDYIDLLNGFVGAKLVEGKLAHLADELDKIALGSFVLSKDGSIYFRPVDKKKTRLSLHLAASSAKSMYGLSQLLRYELGPNDVVMIDEPELNLHPDAQRNFAKFIGSMVSGGLSVMISTHSDYIVREINTLMLSPESPSYIKPNDVELYMFNSRGGATRVSKDAHGNFSVDPFEDSIRALNDSFADVAFR